MNKKTVFIAVLLSILCTAVSYGYATDYRIKVIYFYSSTCSTCHEISSYFDSLKESYGDMLLEKHDILNLKNKSLLDKYNAAYKVSKENRGIVPVVFIRNKYFSGKDNIKENLESELMSRNGVRTIVVNNMVEDYSGTTHEFLKYKTFSVFTAGLVNGLSPCSMSMLLFFLSLIIAEKSSVIKSGLGFISGKFVGYLLLGTLMFSMLSSLNLGWLNGIIKYVMLVFILILTFLNLLDFVAVKNEMYGKIKLQLPSNLKKINHMAIRRISLVSHSKALLPLSFGLGAIISLGEFLCTGQIYLTTIVTILHTNNNLNLLALLYLIVYDIAFIMPLLILTLLMYKGKEVFDVSEWIRGKMHIIKLVNVFAFLAFGAVLLLFW